jgi:ATP-binding cassette subfamily B protein
MSFSFFTNTKTGELMSRLNNDVIGAQQAISNTMIDIVTNLIQTAATLAVMLTLEWRLTLVAVVVLPVFILVAQRLGGRLAEHCPRRHGVQRPDESMMNETLNIGGVLLIKLFGRRATEIERFRARAATCATWGSGGPWWQPVLRDAGPDRRGGDGPGLLVGGHLVLQQLFTIGTIVAFSAYLMQLYGSLQGLTNAPVAFATSMVSFERVFEVIDLPLEIARSPARLPSTRCAVSWSSTM